MRQSIVVSPHKGPVMLEILPCHDAIIVFYLLALVVTNWKWSCQYSGTQYWMKSFRTHRTRTRCCGSLHCCLKCSCWWSGRPDSDVPLCVAEDRGCYGQSRCWWCWPRETHWAYLWSWWCLSHLRCHLEWVWIIHCKPKSGENLFLHNNHSRL